jgi:hypothetical protein
MNSRTMNRGFTIYTYFIQFEKMKGYVESYSESLCEIGVPCKEVSCRINIIFHSAVIAEEVIFWKQLTATSNSMIKFFLGGAL